MVAYKPTFLAVPNERISQYDGSIMGHYFPLWASVFAVRVIPEAAFVR